jgi:hypothetical protein
VHGSEVFSLPPERERKLLRAAQAGQWNEHGARSVLLDLVFDPALAANAGLERITARLVEVWV